MVPYTYLAVAIDAALVNISGTDTHCLALVTKASVSIAPKPKLRWNCLPAPFVAHPLARDSMFGLAVYTIKYCTSLHESLGLNLRKSQHYFYVLI